MANNIYKYSVAFLSLSSIIGLSSCSTDIDGIEVSPSSDVVEIQLKGLPSRSGGDAAASFSVFQFEGESLSKSTVIDSFDAEKISLQRGSTTDLYCVSGIPVAVTPEMKVSEFLRSAVYSEDGADTAPLFLTGYSSVSEDMKGLELTMKRGVARIDIDASSAAMEIEEIVVEDAAAGSYVFEDPSAPLEVGKVSYSRKFDSSRGLHFKNAFLLFESADPVNVDIRGSIDGSPVSLKAVIESVQRNKVYTLHVYDTNVSLSASFSVADWGNGGDIDAGINGAHAMLIDREKSWFPEDVKVDYSNNVIEVPGYGAQGMKLAFVSELRVDLDSVSFSGERVVVDGVAEKYVHISKEKPVNELSGVLTKFGVDVDPQLKGRPGYEFRIYVKKCSMDVSYDFVTVRVAPSPVQIETVRIAGYDWMAFNCTTPDIDDQIYVEEGLSVEDMYINDWVKCVGALFQYGRQYAYIPYQGYDPCNDLGGQTQDMPWIHYSHMPCPEGYHVPSLSEMQSLFPHGVTIPGTYTAGNGESITVELVRLPGDVVTPTNVNGICRYLKFISNETGNTLILPLAGWKGDKSTAASANFGRDGVYWSNNCENCAGGHAKAWRFLFNWGDSCEMQEFQFAMEAFAYIRAIKNY